MIVDEVKTGFRVGKGGAQEHYGIQGDIFTVAKAVGNGYPIAAVCGREDLMRNSAAAWSMAAPTRRRRCPSPPRRRP